MPPQLVELIVPDGVAEGEEFLIDFEGQNLFVACPSGCGPGDPISIEVDAPTEGLPQAVEVVVPDGVFPGMEFIIDLVDGNQVNIVCPEGCEPGSAIVVDVPPPPPLPDAAAVEPPAAEATAQALGDGQLAQPGDRVIITGLASKPYLNGEKAKLISWEPFKGRWKVSVADGELLALKPQNLRAAGTQPTSECAAPGVMQPPIRGLHRQSASRANQMA